MPEAPEVRKYADKFLKFVGEEITLDGKFMGVINSVTRHGKSMFISTDIGVTLKANLYLKGRWVMSPQPMQLPYLSHLQVADTHVYLLDPMRLARIKVIKTSELAVDPSVDVYSLRKTDFDRVYSRRKAMLYSLLMNQKLVAGIGRYLVAEILYDARLLPTRTFDTLADEEKTRLFDSMKKITDLAYRTEYENKVYKRSKTFVSSGDLRVYYDPGVQK